MEMWTTKEVNQTETLRNQELIKMTEIILEIQRTQDFTHYFILQDSILVFYRTLNETLFITDIGDRSEVARFLDAQAPLTGITNSKTITNI